MIIYFLKISQNSTKVGNKKSVTIKLFFNFEQRTFHLIFFVQKHSFY